MRKMLLAALALATMAQAPTITIRGVGGASCSAWIEDGTSGSAWTILIDDEWVMGYLAGLEMGSIIDHDYLSSRTVGAIDRMMDDYCTGHPASSVADAALAITEEKVR